MKRKPSFVKFAPPAGYSLPALAGSEGLQISDDQQAADYTGKDAGESTEQGSPTR